MTRITAALTAPLALVLAWGAGARAADLSLTVDRTSIRKGDFVVYTIHVAGIGEVTDTFDFGGSVSYLSDGCRDAGKRTVVCTATAPDTTFSVGVRYSEVGAIANTATWGSERATVTIDVRPRFGDLAISGTPETPTMTAGSVARFTLTGSNHGPDAMRDVVAAADVRGATFVAVPPECSVKSAIVSCRWPDLAPGGTMASSFYLKATSAGSVRVAFSIRSTDVDTDPSNNDGSAALVVVNAPPPPPDPGDADLAFSMQRLPLVNAGDAFTLTAAVENHGPGAASNVRIFFPRSYALVVEEITSPYAMCGVFAEDSVCWLPGMPSGGHMSLTLHLRAGGLTLLSSRGGGATPDYVPTWWGGRVSSETHDPNPDNNSASDVISVIYPPELSFAPSEPRFRRGDLARYTIQVTAGSGDVVIEHVPPPGLQVLYAGVPNGSCTLSPSIVCTGVKLIDSKYEVSVVAIASAAGAWDVEARVRLNGWQSSAKTRVTVTAPMRHGAGR